MPRLFVAAWPPADVIESLARLPRPAAPGVRWTSPDRLHATLRFLGEADGNEAAAALGSLSLPAATAAHGTGRHAYGNGRHA